MEDFRGVTVVKVIISRFSKVTFSMVTYNHSKVLSFHDVGPMVQNGTIKVVTLFEVM